MDLNLTDTDQPDNFLLPTLLPSFFIRTTEFGPELFFLDFGVENLLSISFNSAIPKISYFQ